jgi:hypothetical protein
MYIAETIYVECRGAFFKRYLKILMEENQP